MPQALNLIKLPLKTFIDCLIDGVPVLENWEDIKAEYFDMTATGNAKHHVKLQVEIIILTSKIKTIRSLFELLLQCWNDPRKAEVVAHLNKFTDSDFKFEQISDIERCMKRSRTLDLKLKLLQTESDELEKKIEAGEELTREYFAKTLILLSDAAKYSIRDDISTFEFCERLKRYRHG